MNYKISASDGFKRELKPLNKKYRSLKNDLSNLLDSLEVNPRQGVELGKSCYKIRLAIKSKGKGKRGGARVITYVITETEEIILLSIYDKKEIDTLQPNELDDLLSGI